LTEHDAVVKSLLRGAPRPGLALGPASARAGPARDSPYRNAAARIDLPFLIAWEGRGLVVMASGA